MRREDQLGLMMAQLIPMDQATVLCVWEVGSSHRARPVKSNHHGLAQRSP